MKRRSKDLLGAVASAGAGAAVGGGTYGLVGGIGIATGGTALAVTVAPFIAVGAGLGAAGYGLYWLGARIGRSQAAQRVEP